MINIWFPLSTKSLRNTNVVIKSGSFKNILCNRLIATRKEANNDLQNTTEKTKEQHESH